MLGACILSFLSWNTQDNASRGRLIATTLSVVLKSAESIFDTWKSYKVYKANATAQEEARQRADAQALDEEAKGYTSDDETIGDWVDSLEDQYGEGGFFIGAGDKSTENGATTDDSSSSDDEEPTFDQPVPTETTPLIPRDVPPSGWAAAQKFCSAVNWLKVVQVCLGIAITVCLGVELKKNWDNLTEAGKVLQTLQVVTQGLTVITDAASIVAEAALDVGVLEADATVLVALPVIGAVLAIIGLVISIVLMFVKPTKRNQQTTPSTTMSTRRPIRWSRHGAVLLRRLWSTRLLPYRSMQTRLKPLL